jgi:hydroxylaminobenzene mutase
MTKLQRMTALAGALLLLIGLLTGGLLAMAMTGKVMATVHDVRAAHLNAILGCFWICAYAATIPMLGYGARGARRLALLTIIPNYGNWLITAVKSFLHVAGVGLDGDAKNDAVFGALNAVVVVPSLIAAAAWVYGLYIRGPRAEAETLRQ